MIYPPIDEPTFKTEVCNKNYIVIPCDDVAYVMLSSISEVFQKTAKFVDLWNAIGKPKMMIIFAIRSRPPKFNIKKSAREKSIKFVYHPLDLISVDMRKVQGIPRHEICSDEEYAELEKFYINKENMPKILENDPQALWINAKIGQIVKIINVSEIAGTAISYRLVIRGHPNEI